MPAKKKPEPPINPKVAAGGVAGAASIVVVWLLGLAGLEVPPEVASAFTTLLSLGTAYLKPV